VARVTTGRDAADAWSVELEPSANELCNPEGYKNHPRSRAQAAGAA
jgi:hypothetical protein